MPRLATHPLLAGAAGWPRAPAAGRGRCPRRGLRRHLAADRSHPTRLRADGRAGVKSVRLPLYWSQIQADSPIVAAPDFLASTARSNSRPNTGSSVFPFVWGTPPWVAGGPSNRSAATRAGGLDRSFLRERPLATGPRGFWDEQPRTDRRADPQLGDLERAEHRHLRAAPTRRVSRELLRASGRVLHGIDPGSKVILGGLFGRPLQVPPNMRLRRLPLPPLPGRQREAVLRRRRRCIPMSPTPPRCAARSATCAGSWTSTTTPRRRST